MKVILEFEGNEEINTFVDFEVLFMGLENVLKRHFRNVKRGYTEDREAFLRDNNDDQCVLISTQ